MAHFTPLPHIDRGVLRGCALNLGSFFLIDMFFTARASRRAAIEVAMGIAHFVAVAQMRARGASTGSVRVGSISIFERIGRAESGESGHCRAIQFARNRAAGERQRQRLTTLEA